MPRRSRRRKQSPSLLLGLVALLVVGITLQVVSAIGAAIQEQPAVGVLLAGIALSFVLAVVAIKRHLRLRRRLRVQTLGELLALTPAGFELAIADLLHDLGYRDVKRTGGGGDLAADIQCHDANGQRVIVQCKRYAPGIKVGSPAIQTFIGMLNVHHQAQRGVFVTTSEYTQPALDLARRHGITLWDAAEVTRLLVPARAKVGAGAAAAVTAAVHGTKALD